MAYIEEERPPVRNPVLLCGWPGIGNVGIMAVDGLRIALGAKEFGHLEAEEFFTPFYASSAGGVFSDFSLPTLKFYYHRVLWHDLIFFIADYQCSDGENGMSLAKAVLEVAKKYHCRIAYTTGAGAAPIHHESIPRICILVNKTEMMPNYLKYDNTIPAPIVQVTGLSCFFPILARRQGLDAVCFLGEVPDYLASVPFPLLSSARAVYKLLLEILGIQDLPFHFEESADKIDGMISQIMQAIPPEIMEKIDSRKVSGPENITDTDSQWLKSNLEDLFKNTQKGES